MYAVRVKHFVKPVYVKAKKKMLPIFVLIAMKNCVLFVPNLTIRDHEVVSLNETSKIDMILIVQKRDICTQHQDKMIE